MKTAVVLAALLTLPVFASAKGPNTQIDVRSNGVLLVAITAPQVLERLTFWSGPGTSVGPSTGPREMSTSPADLADWLGGAVAPPKGLAIYDVTFYCKRRGPSSEGVPCYEVRYAKTSGPEPGFILIPGEDLPAYRSNVSTIYRGVEGSWFRASAIWEEVIRPAIESASHRSAALAGRSAATRPAP